MKTTRTRLVSLLALVHLLAGANLLPAQGTAFRYQGRLNDGAGPANGRYDFRFRLASDPLANNYVGGNVFTNALPISSGLFTVTLDFGDVFMGSDYWLEIGVRTNGGGAYTLLSPLQPLTPAPYAVFAGGASNLLGVIPSGGLSGSYAGAVTFNNGANTFNGTFSGNGGGLSNVNAQTLAGLGAGQFWQVGGNAGTRAGSDFLGTTDGEPLEVKVNGGRVMRWERPTNGAVFGFVLPNVVGGFESNTVANTIGGATIAGGGGPEWFGATVPHRVTQAFGTIGGGVGNVVDGAVSTIAGGERGTITTPAYNSFLGGGAWNTIETGDSVIGGGRFNAIQANGYAGTIGGGYDNTIGASTWYSTIAGGDQNAIQMNADHAGIAGGNFNMIQTNADYAAIGGGFFNVVSGPYGTVPGGNQNVAGTNSFAAGHRAKASHTGAFVWGDSSPQDFGSTRSNQFLVRASGGVGIGTNNPAAALHVNGGGATNIALRVDGGLAVSGAGVGTSTAAFVHVANSTNTSGWVTTIHNPLCDEDPNALLFVTHNWNPPGVAFNYQSNPYSVYYAGNRWTIYNDNGASISNMSFNVLIIKR